MKRQAGFSLIEVLAAVLILTVVILTTIAVFTERQNRLRTANETVLTYQALANEAEVRRRDPFAQLETQPPAFVTDTSLLRPLGPFTTAVTVVAKSAVRKDVTLSIRWGNGKRSAALVLIRTDAGGGANLW
ncbi:MAG TPA: prepilin-type N-terminal cleavage/methylation domain-containing protein [Thermoanaerobaculia bacterium]|jgi:prepilin-type N-terminal cleavage/methylation domain-containing protein|nr:prepilin-type N-terminal cleavage/methylation domain-containing protein [Thermoanaerobaculia bacterium]